jgi:hypothetical protein
MYELLTGRVPMGVIQSLERVRRDIPKDYARAIMRTLSPRPEQRFPSLRELQNVLISHKPVDMADAVFSALGRSIVLGSVAGAAFVALDSLSLSRVAELAYPSGIAAGIGTALILEFCETILRSKSVTNIIAGVLASVLWIGTVLFLSQTQKGSGFSDGLVMMLCGAVGASATELVTRRWGGSAAGRYRLQAALAGAVFGSLLGLMLLVQSDVAGRNYWFSALSGFVPGMIISIASLRRSLSGQGKRPTAATRPTVADADGSWQDNAP